MFKKLFSISIFVLSVSCTEVSISSTYKSPPDTSEKSVDTNSNDSTEDSSTTNESIDTSISSIDTGNSNVDLTNTIGYIETGLMQAACPYCLGLSQEINTKFFLRFHQPTTSSHTSWIPLPGEPCRNYYESSVNLPNIDMGNSVILNNSFGDNINLQKSYDSSGAIYQNLTVPESIYRRNTRYTLNINQKMANDVIETLRGFDYIEPYNMLYVDPSYAFQTPIYKNGNNTFTWGPSGDQSSFFTIHISVYSYDGSIYYGTTICSSNDTGYMNIPGNYFSQYQTGSLTSIHLMRHKITKKQYSDFGGTIEGYSWWEVIGTGYIQ